MKRISPECKASTLAKLLPPYSMTIAAIAQMEGISEATLYNWRNQAKSEGKPIPSNRLSAEEEQQIRTLRHQPENASLPPSQIVPRLADKGVYLASESTFYRVLPGHGEVHHRGRQPGKTVNHVLGLWALSGVDLGHYVVTFIGTGSLVLSVPGGGCVQP